MKEPQRESVMEEVEDDVAELVEWLADSVMMGDRTTADKKQLQWALNKLIDERVRSALAQTTAACK